jgi:hypothetical protein
MSLNKAVDFIYYLYDKKQDELLWERYLHTMSDKSFDEFKKELRVKNLRGTPGPKIVTESEEQERLAFAKQFIKTKET